VSAPVQSWRRKLTFTRLGRWYCGLTLGIGLAAINTGNNLLFLVLALLLASIVLSGVLSENALSQIHLERHLPRAATAEVPALVGLSAANRKRRSPTFSLELRERGGEVKGSAYLLFLGAGESQEVSYRFTPARRGRLRFAGLEVATRSPFGLFEKSRPIDAAAELIVYPRTVPVRPGSPQAAGREGERPQGRAGHGLEVHGLRDHRTGDDARSIHWHSSARAGKLIAVEREEERRRRVCVVLDHRALTGAALDDAVEQAAALFMHALEEGAEVGLALCGRTLAPGSGALHASAVLTALALVEPAPSAEAPRPPAHTAILVAKAGVASTLETQRSLDGGRG
jgi:uncharacterized protein (DUF58 family)